MSGEGESGEDGEALPVARRLHARWPGLVWAVPLAALLIVAYLGVRALTRRGIDATVTFGYAEGVTPGDTKVLMKGVEVGHVTRVHVAPDGHHVEVRLSLDPRTRAALNTNTRFWLIGEYPTITDVQSIRAAVAGVIIAMAPGSGGNEARSFTGLDQPPIIPPGTSGTIYYLDSPTAGSIQPGAAVSYRGFSIGKITRTALRGSGDFRLEMFVTAPFDRLVRDGSGFWSGSPIKFSLSGSSISAGLTSPASVLQGSVQFEPPEGAERPRVPARSVFPLYPDQATAQQGPTGPAMPYRLTLAGAAADLPADAPVTLLGAPVGRVRSARLAFTPGGRPYTDAVILLYPRKIGVPPRDPASAATWRAATDRAVERLLALGYRATLTQSPPLVGPHAIALATAPHVPAATLARGPDMPLLPSSGADSDLLARLGRVPIEEIGANVRRLTANLAAITGSREVRDMIVHLDATARQVDAITAEARPQVGPLLDKLNRTAGELAETAAATRVLLSGQGAAQGRSVPEAIGQLDQAARSIRALTDYLGRHPEALIRGKAKERK